MERTWEGWGRGGLWTGRTKGRRGRCEGDPEVEDYWGDKGVAGRAGSRAGLESLDLRDVLPA